MRVYNAAQYSGIFKASGNTDPQGDFVLQTSGSTMWKALWLEFSKNTSTAGGAMAKPPTFACMWIVRFS